MDESVNGLFSTLFGWTKSWTCIFRRCRDFSFDGFVAGTNFELANGMKCNLLPGIYRHSRRVFRAIPVPDDRLTMKGSAAPGSAIWRYAAGAPGSRPLTSTVMVP